MDFNIFFVTGNLGNDVTFKSENNTFWASFSVGSNYAIDSNVVEWSNIVARGDLAKMVRDSLKKGDKVFVQGRKVTRSFVNSVGAKEYRTDIFAISVYRLQELKNQNQAFSNQKLEKSFQKPEKPDFHSLADSLNF